MPPRPKLAVFDLDGTLVDSLRDIGESLNECLTLLGLPIFPIDSYRYMVGEGFNRLCERAIGQSHPHLLGRLMELGATRYRTRPLRHTRPYRGVPELVSAMAGRGIRLGVLSNKPHDMTTRITQALWSDGVFSAIQGFDFESKRKPDPHHLLRMAEQAGATPRATWLIGDTPTDVETARRAGATCVAVTWGFRTRDDLAAAGARWIVDHPVEVSALLDRAE